MERISQRTTHFRNLAADSRAMLSWSAFVKSKRTAICFDRLTDDVLDATNMVRAVCAECLYIVLLVCAAVSYSYLCFELYMCRRICCSVTTSLPTVS